MKLIKRQISGITNFYIDNLSIELNTEKRYNINLWSEGTQKQGAFAKTLYFDDTLEEWRMRDHDCENKNKSLDFSVVIENNTFKSLETLKAYGIDNGGIAIFNEVYFELNEIGGGGTPTPTKLPIIYEDSYDLSKIISGYLTSFADKPYGLYFRLANNTPKCLATIDYRFDGEITNVGANGNTLTFTRSNQPSVVYTPSVTADITSYTYSDKSTHTISGRAESNWWLIIPKTSFGSTANVLNVRTTKATATSTGGNVDLSSSTMVSVWKVVDATSLPEAIVIDPNATIGDLMVLLDIRNTSNAQVSVNNVEFTIQTNISSIETGNAKLIGYAVVRLNSTAGTVEVVSSTGSIQVVGYGTDEPTIFLIQGFGTIESQYRLISVECFNTEYKVRLATTFDSTYQQFAVTPDTNEYYNIMIWSHKQ